MQRVGGSNPTLTQNKPGGNRKQLNVIIGNVIN